MWVRVGRVFAFLLGATVLASIGYGLYVFLRGASLVFASLDKTVAAAFIAASATIMASAITITVGKIYESRLHVQKENRDKKIPVYEDLLKILFRFLNPNAGIPSEDPEVLEFMRTFNERFIVWASDDVMS